MLEMGERLAHVRERRAEVGQLLLALADHARQRVERALHRDGTQQRRPRHGIAVVASGLSLDGIVNLLLAIDHQSGDAVCLNKICHRHPL